MRGRSWILLSRSEALPGPCRSCMAKARHLCIPDKHFGQDTHIAPDIWESDRPLPSMAGTPEAAVRGEFFALQPPA
jgi:hypothetical protein